MLKFKQGDDFMGRPSGTKNIMRTAEEKEKIVLEYLNNKESTAMISSKHNICISNLKKWIRVYRETGIEGLKSKTGKHNNYNFGRYNRHLSEVDLLKKELLKKEIEIMRLKKGYQVKGVGVKKEYVTTFDANMK